MQDFWGFVAANIPLVLALLGGVALMVVEVFMPGFGIPGLAGIGLMAASIIYVWALYGPMAGVWMSLGAVILMAVAVAVSLRTASKGSFFRIWGLKELDKADARKDDMEALVGKTGVAQTVLRPSGIGEFDGVRLNVVTEGEFIPQDTPISVVRTEGLRIVVKKI